MAGLLNLPKHSRNRLLHPVRAIPVGVPGWPKPGVPSSKSWAYHGDDGGLFCHNFTYPTASCETYGPGDVIGCGVDFDTRSIWFLEWEEDW